MERAEWSSRTFCVGPFHGGNRPGGGGGGGNYRVGLFSEFDCM